MKVARLAFGALLAMAACGGPAAFPPSPRRLIVLGIDGMDPQLTRRFVAEGRMPHLAAIVARGTFLDLATSNPPQSPVAWSEFITGRSAAGHGIYDFVHRNPRTLEPYLSTSRAEDAPHAIELLGWRVPLGSPKVELLRRGRAFWEFLEARRVPVTVVKIPANFPPRAAWRSETLSGMGTPDLLGTYGTFQLFTTDPDAPARPPGGIVHHLVVDGQRARASLTGPPSPARVSRAPLTVPLEIVVDRRRPVALVRLADRELVLRPGEWSGWIPVSFDPGVLAGDLHGMVRLYLRSLAPHIHLYASPINLDPTDPAMPLSSPRGYVEALARDVGRFYTQGMPEDTKALSAGVLTRDEFLAQDDLILGERTALLERELRRFRGRGGLLFFYVSSVDQLSHMFYGSLEPDAPPELARYAHVLPDLYQRVDGLIGRVARELDDHTTLIVMSDHGFAPYHRKVNLNTWLAERGYLVTAAKPGPGPLGHIDWSRTQAYALGLNGLYLNLRGRERHGIVDPGEREVVLARLARELETWRDPETGARVVRRAVEPPRGAFPDRAPDLLVGYARGYRSSDESAMGAVAPGTLVTNHDAWNGDHCMDPAVVPGVLISNRHLARAQASLRDLAPTILTYFGVTPPGDMEGRALLGKAQESP